MTEQSGSDSQNNVIAGQYRALIYPSAYDARHDTGRIESLENHEVMIATQFSAVSRGTERLVYQGNVPPSEQDRMKCPHQRGEFTFPIVYGYACVGEIIEIGNDVTKCKTGDRVFVLHPHQDISSVHENWVSPLPDNLPLDRATLSANAETALNAVWDAELKKTEKVAIIGAGVVGLLTGFIASKFTSEPIEIIDSDPRKKPIAQALGLQFSLAKELKQHKFDVIFHTSASGTGLQAAINCANFEGRIIEMSWYGNKSVDLSLGGAFHSQRLKLISSQVGHIAKPHRHNVSHMERMAQAISILDDNRLDKLLHPRVSFRELPESIDHIFDTKSDALCAIVEYGDQTQTR